MMDSGLKSAVLNSYFSPSLPSPEEQRTWKWFDMVNNWHHFIHAAYKEILALE